MSLVATAAPTAAVPAIERAPDRASICDLSVAVRLIVPLPVTLAFWVAPPLIRASVVLSMSLSVTEPAIDSPEAPEPPTAADRILESDVADNVMAPTPAPDGTSELSIEARTVLPMSLMATAAPIEAEPIPSDTGSEPARASIVEVSLAVMDTLPALLTVLPLAMVASVVLSIVLSAAEPAPASAAPIPTARAPVTLIVIALMCASEPALTLIVPGADTVEPSILAVVVLPMSLIDTAPVPAADTAPMPPVMLSAPPPASAVMEALSVAVTLMPPAVLVVTLLLPLMTASVMLSTTFFDPAPAPPSASPPPRPPAPLAVPTMVSASMSACDVAVRLTPGTSALPTPLAVAPLILARVVFPMSLSATDTPAPRAAPPPMPPDRANAALPAAALMVD